MEENDKPNQDDKPNQNDPRYSIDLAKKVHAALEEGLRKLDTVKQNKATEVIIDAACDAYRSANSGSNKLEASADKQTNHLREEHREYRLGKFPKPRLDLHLSGGKRKLAMESEFGSRREVKKDFKKLQERPINEDKLIVSSTKSEKMRDRDVDIVIKASREDGGTYTHVELHKKKKEKFSKSEVRTRTYIKGDKVYDSKDKSKEEGGKNDDDKKDDNGE